MILWLSIGALFLSNVYAGNEKEKKESLFLTQIEPGNYELAVPKQYSEEEQAYVMTLNQKDYDSMYYACPYKSVPAKFANILLKYDKRIMWKRKYTDDNPIVSDWLLCDKDVESIIWKKYESSTKQDLLNYSNIETHVCGFQVFSEGANLTVNKFPLLEIFFDKKRKQTIAVRHELIDLNLQPEKNHRKFKFSNDLVSPNYTNFYSFSNSSEFFNLLSKKGISFTLHIENRIIKKTLVPYNDFILEVWRSVVYQDANTAPMWEKLTKNWEAIEELVRIILKKYKTLKITTGVSGVLRLPDSNGKLIPLQASKYGKNREEFEMKIPAFWWKAIEVEEGDKVKGIIFVMRNNPLIKSQENINIWENKCNLEDESIDSALTCFVQMSYENIDKLEAESILSLRNFLDLSFLTPTK